MNEEKKKRMTQLQYPTAEYFDFQSCWSVGLSSHNKRESKIRNIICIT